MTDFVQDNYVEQNAAEEEKKLRQTFAFLLRDDEKVCFSVFFVLFEHQRNLISA